MIGARGPSHALLVFVRSVGEVPVPGARVELFPGPAQNEYSDMDAFRFRPSADPPRALAEAVTDGKGAAAFDLPPSGRYWVSAAAPGFGRETVGATVVAGVAPPELIVPLVAGHALDGTVTGDAGGPLAGIDVIAAPTWQCRIWPCDEACDRTRTDPLGRFRFDGLAPGEYGIWYRPEGSMPVCAGIVRIPLVAHLPVHAHRGGVVAGVVKDADTGTPIEGAVVRALDYHDVVRVEARTDAAGRFEVRTNEKACGFLNLSVERSGYVPAYEGPPGTPAENIATGQRLDLDLRLRRAAAVKGQVVGPAGPVAGVRVLCQRCEWRDSKRLRIYDDTSSPDTTSGADGSYRLDVQEGTYDLMVQFSGTRRNWDWDDVGEVDVPAGGDVTHDIHIDLATADVSGSVVDDKGKGVAGAGVWSGEGTRRTETGSDACGHFVLRVNLFQRGAEIAADAPGFAPDETTYDGEPVNLRLLPLVTFMARVRASDGTPVVGARVAAGYGIVGTCVFLYRFDGLCQGVTAADGSCKLPVPVDSDTFLREWSPFDGSAAMASIDMERTPVLDRGIRTVSGQAVLAGSKRGIGGLYASVVSDGETVIHGVTAPDGGFRVRLPMGERPSIQIAGEGYVTTTLKPGVKNEIVVEMKRDLPVDGVVRREGGAPLAGARVVLDGPDDWSSATSTTDTGGRFVILGVPAGEYELVVQAAQDDIESETVQVRAGAKDVEVVLKRVTAAGDDASRK